LAAHIGLFSVFCGILNPQCKVFCFEIDKKNFEKLKQNIKNCKVENVIPFNCAITNRSEVIDYYPGLDCSAFSTTQISFSNIKPVVDKKLKPIGKVKSITLNEVIEENNIDHIDFLKLNCEGAEYEHEEYKAKDLIAYLSKFGDLKKIEKREGVGLIHYTKKQ
jgi:FkbM family methyltransferase